VKVASTPIDRGAALLGLLVVVLANVRYLAGLSELLDPAMSMEPFYIDLAQRPLSDILARDPAWGPLYALWLKPFRAVLADPLRIYAANVYALSLGLCVAVYFYILVLTRRAAVAGGTALFVLVSDFNVPLFSKIFAFTLIVTLAGLTLSELQSRRDRRMAIAAWGVLLASYARPELYPSSLCLWIVAIWFARRDLFALHPPTLGWVVGGSGLMLLVTWFFGTPLWSTHHEGDRLFTAFREHFAWNWIRWNGQHSYYAAIWQREFGAANSILEACLSNPWAVARHVGGNFVGVLQALFGATFDHYPLFAPAAWPRLVRAEAWLVAAVILGSIVAVGAGRERRKQALGRYAHVLIIFAAIAAFPIGGATLIYPRTHYLLVPAVCVLLAGALAVSIVLPDFSVRTPLRRGLLVLVVLALVPAPFVLPTAYFVPGKSPVGSLAVTRNVTDTVEVIRSLDLAKPVHVLTFTDGIGELLGDGFHEVKVWRRGERSLQAYLEDEHVDVIVTMERGRESFLIDDPYWQTIQLDPAAAGFAPVETPGDGVARIWVRQPAR
jgi:hypothetical protein